jgi:uncharacterized protein
VHKALRADRLAGHVAAIPQLMAAEDLLDAALIDLDRGEPISILPLQDWAQWDSHAAARQVLTVNFGASRLAPRYARV